MSAGPESTTPPTLGRVVHYVDASGDTFAAIVTQPGGLAVGLTAFTHDPFVPFNVVDSVPYGPRERGHYWVWPPRV